MEVLDRDPYPLFHRLRAHEPVTYAPAIDQWLVTSRDLGMEILRDAERFRTDSERSPIRSTFGPQMLLLAAMPAVTLDGDRTTSPRGHEFRKPSDLVLHAP